MDISWKMCVMGLLVTVSVAQEEGIPRLELQPDTKTLIKAIGSSAFVLCSATEIDNPDILTDFKWIGPDGVEIGTDVINNRIYAERAAGQAEASVYFTEIRETDSGEYTCEAMAGNIKLNTSFKLEYFRDITWVDAPTEQHPIKGTDAKIKCMVEANPPARVNWHHNGKLIQSGERYILESDGLRIINIDTPDEGVYTCRARVAQKGNLKERVISVEVYSPPEWVVEPEDTEIVELEGASIPCEASGKPNPTYIWTNPENVDVSTIEGFSIDVMGTLNIESVSRDIGGLYRCVAENEADRLDKSVMVSVVTKPKIEEYLNATVNVQDEAVLRCKVSGDPLPDVTFRKLSNVDEFELGVQASDGRIVVEPLEEDDVRVGQLRITEVKRTDDGLYECIARSKGGEIIRNGHITVQFPPTFASTPSEEEWSWESKPVNLTCIAESIPNATITWQVGPSNDEINSEDPHLELIGSGPTSVLRVSPVSSDYYRKYTCKARNLLGEVEHEITLREARRPETILQATYDDQARTATTVTFSFIGPRYDGGKEIDAYAVQYKVAGESWDRAIEKLWTLDSRYVVENLQPQTTYVFRFAARNHVGLGDWGAEQTITMPKRSAPEVPLILGSKSDDVIQSVYHDRYQVQWNIPEANGVPIDWYQIVYYEVKKTDKGWQEVGSRTSPIKVEQANAKEYELKKLKPETYYRLELRAHNDIGYSTPDEVVIRTSKDATSSGPDSGSLRPNSSTTLSPDGSIKDESSQETDQMDIGTTIGIIIAVLFIILVIVDLTCYFINKAGFTYLICTKCCGRGGESQKEKELIESGAKDSEKAPLTDGSQEPRHQRTNDENTPLNRGGNVEVKEDGTINGAKIVKDSAV